MKFLESIGFEYDFSCYETVVINGRLNVLKYLREVKKIDWNIKYIIINAAKYGHLKILKYTYITLEEYNKNLFIVSSALYIAVANGHIECSNFFLENGYIFDKKSLYSAAYKGHLEIIKYFSSYIEDKNDYFRITEGASITGKLDIIKYIYKLSKMNYNLIPWNLEAFKLSSMGGHLDSLVFMHEKSIKNGWVCPWRGVCIIEALINKHFECLTYLISNGVKCPNEAINFIYDYESFKYIYKHIDKSSINHLIMDKLAEKGQLDALKFLVEKGVPTGNFTLKYAAERGHIEVVKYLHNIGCKYDKSKLLKIRRNKCKHYIMNFM